MFVTNLKITLCRTCLQSLKKANGYNIYHNLDLAKKLTSCSGLKVDTTDEYPENVCQQCYDKILLFYEFREMCWNSMNKFQDLLKTGKAVEDVRSKEGWENVNAAKDPLNEDRKRHELMDQQLKESAQEIEVLGEYVEKKKRGRPPKKKVVIEKPQSNVTTKIPSSNLIQKENIDLKDESDIKMEHNEDLVLKQESEVILENQSLTPNKESGKDKTKAGQLEQVTTIKEDANEHEERSPSETESLSSTQGIVYPQKAKHRCDRCSECFNALHRLEAHKREHDGLPRYSCTFEGCGRTFNRWHYFNKHQKEHKLEEDQTFKCDVDQCQRMYKNKSALNVHKRKYHNLGPELKKHMCEVCGKVFKSSAVLNDHRYTHIDRNQLPYACEEPDCSKRFSNKERLKVHKMRHAGIKNFICPHCGMRKTTRNELKIHINYHTLERTWPCRFCPKVCNSAGNLKMHVRNMHERAKDFACRYCDRTFAKADTRKYHEMLHTGEKPHECKVCGRRFVQPAALRTHRKIHLRQKANLEGKEEKLDQGSKGKGVLNVTEQVVEENLITEAMVAEILSDTNGI